jgi:two-component system, OmpR family, phosphate regulon sensor histidine kinase PhoR
MGLLPHIVLRHRGKLTIDSASSAGAMFRVILPAAQGDAADGA